MQVLKKLRVSYSLFLCDFLQHQTDFISIHPLNWTVGNKYKQYILAIFPLGEMTTLLKN